MGFHRETPLIVLAVGSLPEVELERVEHTPKYDEKKEEKKAASRCNRPQHSGKTRLWLQAPH